MKKTLIIFSFLITSLNAQIYMRGVMPLEPGNLWKYNDVGWLNFQINFFVTDSVKLINNIEFNIVEVYQDRNPTDSQRYFGVSPDNFYIRYDTLSIDSTYKYYKPNSTVGDVWIENILDFTFYYTVIDTFTINALGHPFFCKQIKITDSSLVEVYQVWSDSIGLLEENSIGQYDMILRGCVVNGVLYGDTNTYVSVEEELELPKEFLLMQNYPNPFNPSTKIKYSIKTTDLVQLSVYDILGKEVASLVNENKEAGYYSIDFDASHLPSGVYFYRMQSGEFVSSKKMLLIK